MDCAWTKKQIAVISVAFLETNMLAVLYTASFHIMHGSYEHYTESHKMLTMLRQLSPQLSLRIKSLRFHLVAVSVPQRPPSR